jgi:hypothetical protein
MFVNILLWIYFRDRSNGFLKNSEISSYPEVSHLHSPYHNRVVEIEKIILIDRVKVGTEIDKCQNFQIYRFTSIDRFGSIDYLEVLVSLVT